MSLLPSRPHGQLVPSSSPQEATFSTSPGFTGPTPKKKASSAVCTPGDEAMGRGTRENGEGGCGFAWGRVIRFACRRQRRVRGRV